LANAESAIRYDPVPGGGDQGGDCTQASWDFDLKHLLKQIS
jgi:hypothetical protein